MNATAETRGRGRPQSIRSSVADRGMEAQVRIRDLQRASLPLFEAALASGNFAVMSEAKALHATLTVARTQARRLTGYAEGIECPDGIGLFGHGRAA